LHFTTSSLLSEDSFNSNYLKSLIAHYNAT
jgi:hypothetical protein